MTVSRGPFDLPLPRRGVFAVLLTEAGQERSSFERCFHATQWPKWVKTVVPEAADRDALVEWFGLLRFPCVAIVADGMLLGVEHSCSADACERLAAQAQACGGAPFEV